MNTLVKLKKIIFLSLIIPFLHGIALAGIVYEVPKAAAKLSKEQINQYLLPKDHPLTPKLKNLFKNRKMFKTAKEFRKEGFQLSFGHRRLMVASHPEISGYLIKKFPDSTPKEKQIENYIKRINGANEVRKQIAINHLMHLVVPHKWLYRTPYGYVLIVENMDILDIKETNRRYFQIDKEILTELCRLLHALGGCDAFTRNQPFTKSGKIAFVDTEHVGQKKDAFQRHVMSHLRHEMQDYARWLWNKMEAEGSWTDL